MYIGALKWKVPTDSADCFPSLKGGDYILSCDGLSTGPERTSPPLDGRAFVAAGPVLGHLRASRRPSAPRRKPRGARRGLDFVGRLERLEDDWRALRESNGGGMPGCGLPALDDFACPAAHESTHDEDFRRELARLLRDRPGWRRALCTLLEPDYTCFGYNRSACLHSELLTTERRDWPADARSTLSRQCPWMVRGHS